MEIGLEVARADETSLEFLGRWQRLVSTTNWEKGRIIGGWRQALVDAGATPQQYSDEVWSRRVGNVSGQHVGRLRRVFERFGAAHETFAGLYWSHFQAALDWDDAELWLEGAAQNGWSISEMRSQRWEAMGGGDPPPADELPADAEVDEDFTPSDSHEVRDPSPAARADFDPDFGDESAETGSEANREMAEGDWDPQAYHEPPVRPFESLPDLPPDLSEAFEGYKLAILRHRLAGWQDVSASDVLASLDALKQLVLSPAAV